MASAFSRWSAHVYLKGIIVPMASDTARIVTLTMIQRFGLDDLLSQQKGKRDTNAVWHRIRQKIKIPIAIRKDLTITAGNMLLIDPEAADKHESIDVWLETEEVRRLRKLGEETELPAAALEWLEPLMEQLEAKVMPLTSPAELREVS